MALEHVPGKNMGHVVLYALSTCPWCKKTKALFQELGVDYYYEDVDLLSGQEQQDAMAEVERWNPHRSFPTIVFNDSQAIAGFDEAAIRQALKPVATL